MAMEQGQAQAPGQEPQAQGSDPIGGMIAGVAQALDQLSQVFQEKAPDVAQALMQLNEQYRAIIEGALQAAQGGGSRQASGMASPEVGSRGEKTRPAM